jgi:hypothetical protein
MSASFNFSTDTFASAMISHANGQVKRLGIQLKKVLVLVLFFALTGICLKKLFNFRLATKTIMWIKETDWM